VLEWGIFVQLFERHTLTQNDEPEIGEGMLAVLWQQLTT
jgi:hypothetical protein